MKRLPLIAAGGLLTLAVCQLAQFNFVPAVGWALAGLAAVGNCPRKKSKPAKEALVRDRCRWKPKPKREPVEPIDILPFQKP